MREADIRWAVGSWRLLRGGPGIEGAVDVGAQVAHVSVAVGVALEVAAFFEGLKSAAAASEIEDGGAGVHEGGPVGQFSEGGAVHSVGGGQLAVGGWRSSCLRCR
jgi:hypothetical protein